VQLFGLGQIGGAGSLFCFECSKVNPNASAPFPVRELMDSLEAAFAARAFVDTILRARRRSQVINSIIVAFSVAVI